VSKNRKDNWLTWIILAVGLIPLGIGGLWVFMTTTATSLHPNPTETPSVTRSDQSPEWAGAVEQGRQILRTGLTEQNLPGLSVAVGVGGDLVWAEGFGWADLDKRVPIAPETRLRIGTASIVLTSAAVGLLVDKGQLNLDDVIQKHVPEFPEKQWPVTLRQIMGHVAGIRSDSGDEGPLFSEHCEKPVEALPHFANKSL
jgi:CubicO group peptidase (beta-lactamase class C family)